jgi:hypothetical protein
MCFSLKKNKFSFLFFGAKKRNKRKHRLQIVCYKFSTPFGRLLNSSAGNELVSAPTSRGGNFEQHFPSLLQKIVYISNYAEFI